MSWVDDERHTGLMDYERVSKTEPVLRAGSTNGVKDEEEVIPKKTEGPRKTYYKCNTGTISNNWEEGVNDYLKYKWYH